MDQVTELFAYASRIFEPPTPHVLPEFNFQIAGRKVCLRFANDYLAEIFSRAFRHLQVQSTSLPDLVVWTLDIKASGLGPPSFAFPDYCSGAFYYPGPPHFVCDGVTHRIDAYDPLRRIGLLCIPELGSLDSGYLAAPFRNIFHWWSCDQGLLLVHGGAVGTDDGCALLVGRGGSGKSTTVVGCIGSDLRYIGDDYCLIEHGQPPVVHSLYSSGKADARSRSLLPHLANTFGPTVIDPMGKFIAYLAEHVPQSLLQSAPLRAVIVPQVGEVDLCEAYPTSSATALRALAPSTILQFPDSSAQLLTQMTRLVWDIPCWKLLIGRQPPAAGLVIDKIINSGYLEFAS
jgi:hypothetical protein